MKPETIGARFRRELREIFRIFREQWPALALGLAICVLLLAGCAHKAAAPLPPGALNTFDADSYRVLSDAHAAVQSIHDDAQVGKVSLNEGQKTLVNHVIADVNTADHLYKTYHASGSGDTTALTAAIQELVGDLASLSAAFPAQTSAPK